MAATVELLTAAGRHVVHVDATVVMERPKLTPHKHAIRERLAAALGLELGHVSVKATRGEGMGLRRDARGGRGQPRGGPPSSRSESGALGRVWG